MSGNFHCERCLAEAPGYGWCRCGGEILDLCREHDRDWLAARNSLRRDRRTRRWLAANASFWTLTAVVLGVGMHPDAWSGVALRTWWLLPRWAHWTLWPSWALVVPLALVGWGLLGLLDDLRRQA